MLFHNDLENTTEALPAILTKLRDDGYEFVSVSDLIFHEDYSVNADGEQVQHVKSSTQLTPENVEQVMAVYSDELSALGLTEEQLSQAVAAVKGGADIPDEAAAVIAQFMDDLNNKNADNTTSDTVVSDVEESAPEIEPDDIPDKEDPSEPNDGLQNNTSVTVK